MRQHLRYFPRSILLSTQIMCGLSVACSLVGHPQNCGGLSMLPTLNYRGDVVLFSPLPYYTVSAQGITRKNPERGDVVIVRCPTDPSYSVCKRVMGVAGDVVEVEPRRDGTSWAPLFLDEDNSEEGTKDDSGREKGSRKRSAYAVIPKGSIWIVGDNLSASNDSRAYGPVPIASVRGKVVARVWTKGWFDWTDVSSKIRDVDEGTGVRVARREVRAIREGVRAPDSTTRLSTVP